MANFLATQNPTGQVTQLVTANGSETVISSPGGGGGGGIPAPATSRIVYVSSVFGSDTTGDGTESTPFATIAHAQSVVVAPAINNVWEIVVFPGEYTEDLALVAFTRVMGFDTSASEAAIQAVRLAGEVTLGSGFAVDLAFALVSNIYIDGDVLLNYATATSANGIVSFTNCNTSGETSLTQDTGNLTEYHACTCEGLFTVQGGAVNWIGTTGGSTGPAQLRVAGRAGTDTVFDASGGSWFGDLHADQNGIGDQNVTVNLRGFSIGAGTRITAFLSRCPQVNGAYGATFENPTLDGSAANALSPQMRVSQGLIIGSGAVIAAAGTTDVLIPLTGGVLGATSIEDLVCGCTLIGADWVDFFTNQDLAVSWVYVNNAGTNEIHCLIYTPGAGFTTAVSLPFGFWAYLPGQPSPP